MSDLISLDQLARAVGRLLQATRNVLAWNYDNSGLIILIIFEITMRREHLLLHDEAGRLRGLQMIFILPGAYTILGYVVFQAPWYEKRKNYANPYQGLASRNGNIGTFGRQSHLSLRLLLRVHVVQRVLRLFLFLFQSKQQQQQQQAAPGRWHRPAAVPHAEWLQTRQLPRVFAVNFDD